MSKYTKQVTVVDTEALEEDLTEAMKEMIKDFSAQSGESFETTARRVSRLARLYYGMA